MIARTRLSTAVIVLTTAVVAAGCGASPTSPSAIGGSVGGAGGGAFISGTVTGVTQSALSTTTSGSSGSLTVTVAGTNISTTVSGAGQFTLTDVPDGNVELKFSGRGVDASITISGVADGDLIQIVVSVNGNGARLEREHRERGNKGREVEGLISAIDAVAHTVTVNGKVIEVPASAAIRHGDQLLTFADLHVGDRVHVRTTTTTDGDKTVAVLVKLQDRDDEDDDLEVKLHGVVSGLTGTCPALTFSVNGTTVKTNGTTTYDGACAEVLTNAEVEVKGQRQADGSMLATRIELEH